MNRNSLNSNSLLVGMTLLLLPFFVQAQQTNFAGTQAYEVAENGKRSGVHWDMVMIQTPEYRGGEIYFDGDLVRKDGVFTVPELLNLNPDSLK